MERRGKKVQGGKGGEKQMIISLLLMFDPYCK